MVFIGGEGGIRTLSAPVESVTYRFYIAYDAIFATVAVDHCPFLLTGTDAPLPLCRPVLSMPARIGRLPALDQPREKVVRLLAVDDTGKCAVLPIEEHPGMHQHADEKPRLTFGKREGRHSIHAFRAERSL